MFKSYRKLISKLAAVCVLAAGVYVAQNNPVNAKTDCPVCPVPYHCNFWTMGDCVCDCPNLDGSCPAGCA